MGGSTPSTASWWQRSSIAGGEHVINLFVAKAASAGHTAARGEAVQGFNTQRWSDQGLHFIAISDLSNDDLRDFHVKFEAGLRAGA